MNNWNLYKRTIRRVYCCATVQARTKAEAEAIGLAQLGYVVDADLERVR